MLKRDKFLLYLLQKIVVSNKLFILESVEHNVEEENIELDNLDHLLNFETNMQILLNMPFITTV